MTSTTYDAIEVQARPLPRLALGWLWRLACAVWKFLVALLLTTNWLLSVLVVGWTCRFMQRTAFKAWWRQSHRPYRKMISFRSAAATTPGWIEHASWPNWVISQDIFGDLRRGRVHRLLGGLWDNLRFGLQSIVNTSVVLALPCLLWTLAWYAGWQVSFNKAYEYFQNGALLGLTASALFIVAMFYVPMAQARQAVSGVWRSFYDFRQVRRVIRRRWFACALLALAYAVAGLFVLVFFSIVPMATQFGDWLNSLDANRRLWSMKAYFLGGAAVLFPLFVALRWFAARIYASAIGQMLSTGEIRPDELSSAERLAFPPELVNAPEARDDWSRADRAIAWSKSLPARIILGIVVTLAWALVVAEIFIGQFFIFRGPRVWLNHPLVQLPWTDYTPAAQTVPL
jgi:hypothetical protein